MKKKFKVRHPASLLTLQWSGQETVALSGKCSSSIHVQDKEGF